SIISGNAMYSTKRRMFSHGTLTIDTEIEEVVKAINVNKAKIESKGIKSIRSRVANISEFLEEKITIETFKELILKYVFDVEDVKYAPQYELTDEDWENVQKISENCHQV